MKKENIENRFSVEIDAYLKGKSIDQTSGELPEEYYELLELGKKLADKDFSNGSNKKEIFEKVKKNQ